MTADLVSDEQLAEWEALANAATPGPWLADVVVGDVYVGAPAIEGWIARLEAGIRDGGIENASFIAAVREAIPVLVRALRDARAAIRAGIETERSSNETARRLLAEMRSERDSLRAENEALRQLLVTAAKTLQRLPLQYTVAEENALRVVSLLHSDCYRLGAELAALAAPTGQEKDTDG